MTALWQRARLKLRHARSGRYGRFAPSAPGYARFYHGHIKSASKTQRFLSSFFGWIYIILYLEKYLSKCHNFYTIRFPIVENSRRNIPINKFDHFWVFLVKMLNESAKNSTSVKFYFCILRTKSCRNAKPNALLCCMTACLKTGHLKLNRTPN